MDSNFIMELINKIVALITGILETLGLDTSKVPSFDLEGETEETV